MKREIPSLLPNYGRMLELGPGFTPLPGCSDYLDYPEWNADIDVLPDEWTEKFDVVHMYHFLEHVKNPVGVLLDCQKVLMPGGHANIVVPYGNCDLAIEDIDHKHRFTEETWRKLFNNNGYDKNKHKWRLEVHACFIMAVANRNMGLFTQLVKV